MQKKSGGKRITGNVPSGRSKKKRTSRLTLRQKLLTAVAVVLAIALVGVVAYQNLFSRPDVENKVDKKPEQDGVSTEIDYGEGVRPKADGERKSQDFYTVLILGRDTGGGGNTDTMLLASYDVTNQKATVMSIPRDTMVNVSWDVKKINSVYNRYGGGDEGVQAVYKEISQLVGFEPDFRVVVEWEAVGKLVDAIGGVYFDVPYQMDYHDEWQDLVIEQDKGYRLLSGEDAMQVIRFRKNDKDSPYGRLEIGDSGRMKLQQSFLKAVIQQMMKPANVLNIGKIAQVFEDCVETDLSFQEILWFGKQAVSGGLSISNVEFLTMPWTDARAYSRTESKRLGTYRELAYVVPVARELLDIVNNKLSPFVEVFGLENLDIMYVNVDGSIGSTTGHVEDELAAVPPAKPSVEPPSVEEPAVEVPEVVDPVPEDPMEEMPETGETIPENPEETEPAEPESPPESNVEVPEEPEVPMETITEEPPLAA